MYRSFLSLFILLVFGFLNPYCKTFLFIGDSITDGNWGSPKGYPCNSQNRNQHDKNHILGHGFVEMTAGYFMGEYPDSNFYFINRGISGETSSQIAARWDIDVMDLKPDIVSLLCGTNDVHYWFEKEREGMAEFPFKHYYETLDSIINVTLTALPDCKVVLCTPFIARAGKLIESPDYELRKEVIDSLATIIRNLAESKDPAKVKVVDFNALVDKLMLENPNPEYWIWDGVHPTTAMHHRMSKEWIEKNQPD